MIRRNARLVVSSNQLSLFNCLQLSRPAIDTASMSHRMSPL